MPHPELIFLHSESADGCNNAQHVPPVSSNLKNASKQWPVAQTDPPTAADVIEDEKMARKAPTEDPMAFARSGFPTRA